MADKILVAAIVSLGFLACVGLLVLIDWILHGRDN